VDDLTPISKPVPASTPRPSPVDNDVVRALGAHVIYNGVALAWSRAVARLDPVVEVDQKTLITHTRVLEDPRAMQVLQLIWLSGESVDEDVRAMVGLKTSTQTSPLTCHGLATASCSRADELPRTHKRMQNIIAAGHVFGLIEKTKVTAKKHLLVGTPKLHEVMLKLGQPPRARRQPNLARSQGDHAGGVST